LKDRPPCPGVCPVLENRAPIHRILKSGDKDLLCLVATCGQEERQPVQAVGLLLKDSPKIIAACVWRRARVLLCLRHVHLRGDSCGFLRASSFSTCLMRTPAQKKLATFCIRSKIRLLLAANDRHGR
jgi:hypothetical protein